MRDRPSTLGVAELASSAKLMRKRGNVNRAGELDLQLEDDRRRLASYSELDVALQGKGWLRNARYGRNAAGEHVAPGVGYCRKDAAGRWECAFPIELVEELPEHLRAFVEDECS